MDNVTATDIATSLECCFKNMDGDDCCSSCSFCSLPRDSCYHALFTSTISTICDLQARLSRIQSILNNVSDDIDSIHEVCNLTDKIL